MDKISSPAIILTWSWQSLISCTRSRMNSGNFAVSELRPLIWDLRHQGHAGMCVLYDCMLGLSLKVLKNPQSRYELFIFTSFRSLLLTISTFRFVTSEFLMHTRPWTESNKPADCLLRFVSVGFQICKMCCLLLPKDIWWFGTVVT